MYKELTDTLYMLSDAQVSAVRERWFSDDRKEVLPEHFLPNAIEWFQGSKLIDVQGWNTMTHADLMFGCTHFIENFCLKNKWNIQVLPTEYPYYQAMGMTPTEPGNLKPNVPLIISLPNHFYADVVDYWESLLEECEQKNIMIDIDGAYMISAKDITIDLAHPNINSIGMSLTKFGFGWNRIGVRWTKNRTVDSIQIFNFKNKMGGNVISCGQHIINNIDRDHGWNTHADVYNDYVNKRDMLSTKVIHIVKDKHTKTNYGIGQYLSDVSLGKITKISN